MTQSIIVEGARWRSELAAPPEAIEDRLVEAGLTPDFLELRAISDDDRKNRVARFVASTPAVDSYDEVVEQTWDLARYTKNPVILWAHDRWSMPLGKAVDVGLNADGNLEIAVQFATEDINPFAERVWRGVQGGYVRAVSVGFKPRDVRLEKRDDREIYVLANNELYEVSIVPVPANPESLAKMRARALRAVNTNKEKDTMDLATQLATAQKQLETSQTQLSAETARASIAEARATAAEKSLADEKTRSAALESANKSLVVERDTAKAELAKLSDETMAKEVDALVGVKIVPADREKYLRLRKADPALFTDIVATLTAKNLTTEITPKDEVEKTPTVGRDGNAKELEQSDLDHVKALADKE